MSATPLQVVAAARSYRDVRFHHQGRTRAGLDCIGLCIRTAHDCGLSEFDTHDYARMPDGVSLLAGLREHCVERFASPEPGMLALFGFGGPPQHVGFLGNYPHGGLSLIHAYATNRKVVEHRLDIVWQARIVALFDLPGVQR